MVPSGSVCDYDDYYDNRPDYFDYDFDYMKYDPDHGGLLDDYDDSADDGPLRVWAYSHLRRTFFVLRKFCCGYIKTPCI